VNNSAGLNLAGLGLVAAGGVLIYSGVNDPTGGPLGVVRDVLRGKTPTPGVRLVTAPTTVGNTGNDFAPIGAGAVANTGDLFTPIGASASGAAVVNVAKGYLGTPYMLGGASHTSIDCSGLVMVAYRDGAGISLPHRATAQAARGRAIPRDQARAGDLVAWGVPGNYPHIALAVDNSTCIGAWTYGVPCRYDKIDQRAVPGFGLPDIIRILG
jgi:cell wall-associated NlpC family hydrolase